MRRRHRIQEAKHELYFREMVNGADGGVDTVKGVTLRSDRMIDEHAALDASTIR